jgi:hypothetical protein
VSGRKHYRDISWRLFSADDARCNERWGSARPRFPDSWAMEIGAPAHATVA